MAHVITDRIRLYKYSQSSSFRLESRAFFLLYVCHVDMPAYFPLFLFLTDIC